MRMRRREGMIGKEDDWEGKEEKEEDGRWKRIEEENRRGRGKRV